MRCLRTFWPACVPSCDLSIVLKGLPKLFLNHLSQLQVEFWLSRQSWCWRLHPIGGLVIYRLYQWAQAVWFLFSVWWKFWSVGMMLRLRYLPKVASLEDICVVAGCSFPTLLSDFIIWTQIWQIYVLQSICVYVHFIINWQSLKVWQCGIVFPYNQLLM